MKNHFKIAIFIVLVVLACCFTSCTSIYPGGINNIVQDSNVLRYEVHSLELEGTLSHWFFTGVSKAKVESNIKDDLLKEARKLYGDNLTMSSIRDVRYTTNWSGWSFLMYFDLLGYVEVYKASCNVYVPITDTVENTERAIKDFHDSLNGDHEHIMVENVKVVKPSTCTENGLKEVSYECHICGYTYDVTDPEKLTIVAPGHKLEEVTSTIEPTCTEEGKEIIIYKCSICGYIDENSVEKVLEPLGHDMKTIVTVIDATCTEEGKEITKNVCSRCGYSEIISEKVLPLASHNYVDSEFVKKRATTTEAGIKTVTRKCSVCGDVAFTKDKVIPVIDLSESNWGEINEKGFYYSNANAESYRLSSSGYKIDTEESDVLVGIMPENSGLGIFLEPFLDAHIFSGDYTVTIERSDGFLKKVTGFISDNNLYIVGVEYEAMVNFIKYDPDQGKKITLNAVSAEYSSNVSRYKITVDFENVMDLM